MLTAFAVLLGLLGGIFGGIFSRLLAAPSPIFLPKSWWMRTMACGALCSLIAFLSRGSTSGSGYTVTKNFMENPQATLPALFFPEKFLTTIVSYLSGIAGGIFSPCLSIGAGLGAGAGQLLQFNDLRACAL